MDAGRLELYDLLKPKLDDEAARKLVLALPRDSEDLATKTFVHGELAAFESRMEARFAHMDARFAQMEATLTRRMVAIMGGWTVLLGSAFAWASIFFR